MPDGDDELWREQRRHWRALDDVAKQHAAGFVGMSAEAARTLADELRLSLCLIDMSFPDGAMVTDDYVLGRLTAYAVNGTVVRCSAG